MFSKIKDIFRNLYLKVISLFREIRKAIVIRKVEKEISEKLRHFKKDFDSFLNEYYDYLPLPQGKSIIQNTLKSGKTFYLVVFNDVRKKHVSVVEIFSDPYSPLPSGYNLFQKIDITSFMDKIKENIQEVSRSRRKSFLN